MNYKPAHGRNYSPQKQKNTGSAKLPVKRKIDTKSARSEQHKSVKKFKEPDMLLFDKVGPAVLGALIGIFVAVLLRA